MEGLAVYVKEGFSFAWDLSLENSADSHLCFPLSGVSRPEVVERRGGGKTTCLLTMTFTSCDLG